MGIVMAILMATPLYGARAAQGSRGECSGCAP